MAESPVGTREAQLNRLLQANRQALSRLVASYARSASDREDLLQEIAIALWRALPGFRGECSERAFLFRIAHNRCMTYVAKRVLRVHLSMSALIQRIPAAILKLRFRRNMSADGSWEQFSSCH